MENVINIYTRIVQNYVSFFTFIRNNFTFQKLQTDTLITCLLLTLTSTNIMTCPTCIGTIEFNSPKFFTDEAYISQHQRQNNEVSNHIDTSPKPQEEKQ